MLNRKGREIEKKVLLQIFFYQKVNEQNMLKGEQTISTGFLPLTFVSRLNENLQHLFSFLLFFLFILLLVTRVSSNKLLVVFYLNWPRIFLNCVTDVTTLSVLFKKLISKWVFRLWLDIHNKTKLCISWKYFAYIKSVFS